MTHLRAHRTDAKHIRVTGIDPFLAYCLQELPEVLKRGHDSACSRLFPPPTTDNDVFNEEWERLVAPELRHLFASAGETIARGLTGLERDPRHTNCAQVEFPAAHLSAWMSAINQSRLILAEQFQMTEADMEARGLDLGDPKHEAVFKVHALGYLLHQLVELEG